MTSAQLARSPYVGPLDRIAFVSMCLFVFFLHSRILDLWLPYLHIPILTLWVAIGTTFLGGGLWMAFSNRIGIALLLLSAWMVVAIPFAYWPGGAAGTVKDWLKTMLVFFVIAGAIKTFGQFRRAIFVFAFSVLSVALLAIPYGSMEHGRLTISRGRFTNPNDLAQILLMGLPFWWFFATNKKLKTYQRTLAALSMVPIFMAMAKTGSRGALFAFCVVGFVLFWRSSVSHKVLIMTGGTLFLVLAGIFLPQATKDRYFTLFEQDEAEQRSALQGRIEENAVSSARGRWALLRDSIRLTLLNPVFGVGAGQFVVAQDEYSRAVRGRKGSWHVTHNTFTEWSSENGLPALLFFILAVCFTFRAASIPENSRPRGRPEYNELSSLSFSLRLSLVAYLASAMFGSFAYATQFPVLAALAVAFHRVAAIEIARRRTPVAVPVRYGPSTVPRLRTPVLGASA